MVQDFVLKMKRALLSSFHLSKTEHVRIRFLAISLVITWNMFSPALQPDKAASFAEESTKSFLIPQPPPDADQAAAKGRTILELIVRNDNNEAGPLGFISADEVTTDSMKIGQAMPIMEISIETLRSYSSNQHPVQLLKPTAQFIYPIMVGGKVRSSITVRKMQTGQWRAVAFGAVGWPLAAEERNILDSALIVRLYALERFFLGTLRGNDLTLFRVAKYSKYRTGEPENGRKVFENLATEIKGLNPEASDKRYRWRSPQPKTYDRKE